MYLEVLMTTIFDLIQEYETVFWWLVALSPVLFIFTLLAIPWLIVRIPEDYFKQYKQHKSLISDAHPVARLFLIIFKNIAGIVFIVAGIFMLALPGQGILTIFVGLILLNFPGKRRFVFRLVSQPVVIRTINKVRKRAGKGPVLL